MLNAASDGDVPRLRALLDDDRTLAQAGYGDTPPLHFAVHEGHLDAMRLLLEAGADPNAPRPAFGAGPLPQQG